MGLGGRDGGTSGGGIGTGGGGQIARNAAFAALALLALLQGAANGVSRFDDLRGAGGNPVGWQIAVDEASSLLVWFALMVVIWRFVALARPPRLSWPMTIAAHITASVIVSLLHVGLFVLLRHAAYGMAGVLYDYSDNWVASLLYEYRKDAVSYAILALAMGAIQWSVRAKSPVAATPASPMLEVGDGATRHRVPVDEITWIEAAGNYVALHWQGRSLLHRSTLAALEHDLGAGFARIHRSRLVRRDAVRRIDGSQSGDFTVVLVDGTELRGSRRYREGLRGA